MDYCKYHPLQAGTFVCQNCELATCDTCIDDSQHLSGGKCFICHSEMDSLGAKNTAQPFWRRLQQSFEYPMNAGTVSLIIGVALLGSFIGYLPFGFWLTLAVEGAFFKFCMTCLSDSSEGKLSPPDITVAYEGGIEVALKVILMIAFLFAAVVTANYLFGTLISTLLAILFIAGLPAMLINYAMSEDIIEAMNPLNMIRLMGAIGLPYGLLLGFIMLMFASVGVIQELFGESASFVATILQASVSNYYMIVVFHIMGYIIFQYQDKLGFTARLDDGEHKQKRSLEKMLAAEIDVFLKEGNYKKVDQLLNEAAKKFPNEKQFNVGYFDFLLSIGSRDKLSLYAPRYFNYLKRHKLQDKMPIAFKQILQSNKDYIPASAKLRYELAQICMRSGDPKLVVKLIKGLHKSDANFPNLIDAYKLLSEALDDLPKMQQNADKCRKLIEHLKQKNKESTDKAETLSETAKKSSFTSAEDAINKKTIPKGSKTEQRSESGEPEIKENGWGKDLPPLDFK